MLLPRLVVERPTLVLVVQIVYPWAREVELRVFNMAACGNRVVFLFLRASLFLVSVGPEDATRHSVNPANRGGLRCLS